MFEQQNNTKNIHVLEVLQNHDGSQIYIAYLSTLLYYIIHYTLQITNYILYYINYVN